MEKARTRLPQRSTSLVQPGCISGCPSVKPGRSWRAADFTGNQCFQEALALQHLRGLGQTPVPAQGGQRGAGAFHLPAGGGGWTRARAGLPGSASITEPGAGFGFLPRVFVLARLSLPLPAARDSCGARFHCSPHAGVVLGLTRAPETTQQDSPGKVLTRCCGVRISY